MEKALDPLFFLSRTGQDVDRKILTGQWARVEGCKLRSPSRRGTGKG